MSQHDARARPRQVTIGGWVIAVASAMLVVTVFDSMGNLYSVDTREQLTRALTTGSARELGISVEEAVRVLRGLLFVAGVAAATTGILGIFVLQRHTAARIALTVAAVPVVLTAPFSGGFLGMLIGASTAMLWTRPARDWFAGRPVSRPERPRPVPTSSRPGSGSQPERPAPPPVARPQQADQPSRPLGEGAPPPMPGWGQAPGRPAGPGTPPAYPGPSTPTPSAWTSYGPPTLAVPPGVPVQVRIGCILTWVFTLLTAGLYLLLAIAITVDRQGMLDLLRENPSVRNTSLTDSELVAVIIAVSVVIVVWCLATAVLAIFAWRRQTWAWIALLISTAIAGLACLLGVPFSLLHLAASVTVFVLLLKLPVRAWFRGVGGIGGPGSPAVAPPAWQPPAGYPPPPTQQPGQAPPPPPEDPQGKPPVW